MTDQLGLTGRSVVVTGGAQGLGAGVVAAYEQAGARVAVVDVADPPAAPARLTIRADIISPVEMAAAAQRVVEVQGGIDVWVNNAGGWAGTEAAPLLDTEVDDFDSVVDLNLRGTFVATQAAARVMVASGAPGAIVNVCSLQGVRASPQQAAYGAAKAAVGHLTQTAALELAPHSIRVNAVAPSFVDTPAAAAKVSPERRAATIAAMPLGRIASPAEVAGMILALGSELAAFTTGQLVVVDGGLSLTTARPHRGQPQS